MRASLLFLCSLAIVACSPGDEAANNDSLPNLSANGLPQPAVLAATISGFETPESVKYDPDQDVYFVTNINGGPSAKDDNGFISRVHADSLGFPLMRWVASGRNGVQLHAPKGMAIVGDTLWVADIDQLRAFNRLNGNPLGSVDLAPLGAVFLNDIAAGPDGALYVTDTGIHFDADGNMTSPGPNRVYRVSGRTPSVAVEGDALANPNGIAWSVSRSRFVIGSFGGPNVLDWAPGERAPNVLASGPGSYDGVEVLADGRVLLTSWADSSLYVLPAEGGELQRVVAGVDGPADIGWDEGRQRVAIPLFSENRVVMYDLAPGDR
jgi:sugar lactone lactonase YvrE